MLLPTGGGKSLCFQLPSLLLPGLTVVVLPLLSLMKDQVRRCAACGLETGTLQGGQSAQERQRLYGEIQGGRVRLLFTTPESLARPSVQEVLGRLGVAHLVVDEAHCIWEWGASFRPAYLGLGQAARRLRAATVTAFTATASEEVLSRIREALFAGSEVRLVRGDPDRPNITYGVLPVLSKTRALERLSRSLPRPLLAFHSSREATERTARSLRERLPGEEVFFYHAGLNAGERARVEGWFLPSDRGILTATSAYGLGVDKANIRSVVHADVPPSVEAYLQESGRAGRDGLPSQALLLCSFQDLRRLRGLKDPWERRRFGAILRYALGRNTCRRRALLANLAVDRPPCSGCDVCRGEAANKPEGQEEILNLAGRYGGMFTSRQFVQLLAGSRSYEGVRGGLDRLPGFGILADWREEDIEEALEAMLLSGVLALPERGLRKHRIVLQRKEV